MAMHHLGLVVVLLAVYTSGLEEVPVVPVAPVAPAAPETYSATADAEVPVASTDLKTFTTLDKSWLISFEAKIDAKVDTFDQNVFILTPDSGADVDVADAASNIVSMWIEKDTRKVSIQMAQGDSIVVHNLPPTSTGWTLNEYVSVTIKQVKDASDKYQQYVYVSNDRVFSQASKAEETSDQTYSSVKLTTGYTLADTYALADVTLKNLYVISPYEGK
jgi:hypothetical protein